MKSPDLIKLHQEELKGINAGETQNLLYLLLAGVVIVILSLSLLPFVLCI